jgi:alpha-L-rhamnosidase
MSRRLATALLASAFAHGASPDPTGAALQASMIWPASSSPVDQAYVAFRGTVALDAAPSSDATLHVFADSRYMLWVNGAHVARGPCRFNPKRPEYDSHDVRSLLRPGNNSLVALVHHYGPGVINGRIMAHAPALAARLVVDNATVAETDTSWRSSNATEYRPSPAAWSSIPDVIDLGARVALGGDWTAPAFNDAVWERAALVDGSSWGPMMPRGIPLPRETPLSGLTLAATGAPLDFPFVVAPGSPVIINISAGMSMVYVDASLIAPASGGAAAFHVEFALRFRGGAPAETYGVGTAVTLAAAAGPQRVISADTWCAHYVTLTAVGGAITVANFTLVKRAYPFVRAGSFDAGSDSLLTEVWRRSVNTLAAVTDDAYGSDARERNEWLQDPAEPNFITTRVAFATEDGTLSDSRLLRNLLRHAALSQLADGRILSTFPTDRGPEDCHYSIEDYAMQWVEALRMYFDSTGDGVFLAEVWPVLVAQMAYFAARVQTNSTGLLLAREYTSFDDPWAYVTGQGAALNAFYFRALDDAAYIAAALGEAAAAAAFTHAAADLARFFDAALFNASAGTYNSGILPSGATLGPTVHAALLALERGVVPAARVAGVRAFLLANVDNEGATHCCVNNDAAAMVAAKSGVDFPVVMYWVFRVLYAIDTPEADVAALAEVRSRWGPMIASSPDIDTLYESFQDSESCHNYGAVPAYFLSSFVLGVRLDGAAARGALMLEPRLGDLASARGAVVTELGIFTVAWVRNATTLNFSLSLPAGAGLARAALRLAGVDGASVVVNGAPVATTADGRYAVALLAPGDYVGTARVSP